MATPPMTRTASPIASRIAVVLEAHVGLLGDKRAGDVDALCADLVVVVDELIAEAVADAIHEHTSS
jgi:hypothetical protein